MTKEERNEKVREIKHRAYLLGLYYEDNCDYLCSRMEGRTYQEESILDKIENTINAFQRDISILVKEFEEAE